MQQDKLDTFKRQIAEAQDRPSWMPPAAYGLGIARMSNVEGQPKVLDTYYPRVNVGSNLGFAALLAEMLDASGSRGTHEISMELLNNLAEMVAPILETGNDHPNAAAVSQLIEIANAPLPSSRVVAVPVVTFIAKLDEPPTDASDVYLRLHLLSTRAVRPHQVNLDGAFGLLNNVVWTSHGPFDPVGFEDTRCELRGMGVHLAVTSVDKFPRMTDYVIPSGVRVADADRVRLGGYLADGTTVMHEGFVNFNAGTLGSAMIEGRISAGVVTGNNTDVGGGASIMGTLSGGGKEQISVGDSCLLGANSGIGISLGNNCVVEAGLYITSGSRVTLPDGTVVKAADLSGRSDMLFIRNSVSGAIEMRPQSADWSGLNSDLHSND